VVNASPLIVLGRISRIYQLAREEIRLHLEKYDIVGAVDCAWLTAYSWTRARKTAILIFTANAFANRPYDGADFFSSP
jgi:hypothetical protein